LHAAQVQALLLRRYRPLADLQFSCYRAPEGERACSQCAKCFGIALVALGEGVSPRTVGIDPLEALMAYADWHLADPPGGGSFVTMSGLWTARVVRVLQRRSTHEVAATLAGEPHSRVREALAVYARLRAESLAQTVQPEQGYLTAFLGLVRSDLRVPLEHILAQHFEPTSGREFTALAKRVEALTDWITEPLADRSRWRVPRAGA
jgi:hypothetical protein